MERRHRLSEIAAAVGGRLVTHHPDVVITELVVDSRTAAPTDATLFVALKGERQDGHKYLKELAARGLRHALVNEGAAVDVPGLDLVVVPDTWSALQQLAAWHRRPYTYPVVGITGSNGKTLVKEWIFQALGNTEHVVRSPGSWNSQVGVPLSVWEMGPQHTIALFEAGISKPGEMERLAHIMAPTVGVFTNIGPAHGEHFPGGDLQKAREKALLFTQTASVVHCRDHELVRQALEETCAASALIPCWSRKGDAFVRVVEEERQENDTRLLVRHAGVEQAITIPFSDAASVENALHVITLLLHLDRPLAWVSARMVALRPVEMRLRMTAGIRDITLIDDSYSNDIASLGIALDHLVRVSPGRDRVAVVSDILEGGGDEHTQYSTMARQLTSAGVKRVFGLGPAIARNAALFPMELRSFADAPALLREVDPSSFAGAAVLVKGARTFQLEQVVERWQERVHGTVLEVDLDALRHNLHHFRAIAGPEVKLMAMVKAFGYGSGALELARTMAHERVDYLGVAYADEGIELRQQGIDTPVLVMNPEPVPLGTLHRFRLEAEVYDRRSMEEAIAFATHTADEVRVHIKLDTGMHRLGFMHTELEWILSAMRNAGRLRVASILSHLAASEDPQHDAFTRRQITLFASMAGKISETLGYRPLLHIANSGAITRFPEARFDMVRLGIGLHGVGADAEETGQLLPTATLRTVVAQVKDIPAGESVGYGRRAMVDRRMRIAILPIGYADGLSRRLGHGAGRVWIHGRPAMYVGSICMDMCMVDVTEVACSPGDDAIVFGPEHPLQDFARDLGTIPYEALTSISSRVRRVYTRA
jgi:alanine racemase